MSKLILIRHGETLKNVEGIVHASRDEERLTEVGRIQIRKAANRLKEHKLSSLYTSDEPRAIESATILSDHLNIPYAIHTDLRERDWGALAGKPWNDIQRFLEPFTLEERYVYIPPGGESWQQFEDRIKQCLNELILDSYEDVALVSHGGVIRALMPYLLGLPREESFKYVFDNASLTIFDSLRPPSFPEVINDTRHLA